MNWPWNDGTPTPPTDSDYTVSVVREIAVPDYVVIDGKTRVMRAVYR